MSAKKIFDELTGAGLSLWIDQKGELRASCSGTECSAQIDKFFARVRSNAPALRAYIRESKQNLVRTPEQPAPPRPQAQREPETPSCGCHRAAPALAEKPAEDTLPSFMNAAYRGV